jgi:hypothetical protein
MIAFHASHSSRSASRIFASAALRIRADSLMVDHRPDSSEREALRVVARAALQTAYSNAHSLVDLLAVPPLIHHRIINSGFDCQRAFKRLTNHSHHRSKESLLSALGSIGFGAADVASGAMGLAEFFGAKGSVGFSCATGSVGFFGAKGLAGFSSAMGSVGFSTNRLKQISRSLSSFKKRQSFTTPANPGFGLVRGDTIAS